jgi:hypothetical protein
MNNQTINIICKIAINGPENHIIVASNRTKKYYLFFKHLIYLINNNNYIELIQKTVISDDDIKSKLYYRAILYKKQHIKEFFNNEINLDAIYESMSSLYVNSNIILEYISLLNPNTAIVLLHKNTVHDDHIMFHLLIKAINNEDYLKGLEIYYTELPIFDFIEDIRLFEYIIQNVEKYANALIDRKKNLKNVVNTMISKSKGHFHILTENSNIITQITSSDRIELLLQILKNIKKANYDYYETKDRYMLDAPNLEHAMREQELFESFKLSYIITHKDNKTTKIFKNTTYFDINNNIIEKNISKY